MGADYKLQEWRVCFEEGEKEGNRTHATRKTKRASECGRAQ